MWQLLQFPLCPFSRKVRLQLGEKGIAYSLKRENPWDHRDEFLHINPAARTPVMQDEARGVNISDSVAISEYIEEVSDKVPLISGSSAYRAEIRRLVAWFDQQFYGDVTAPLLHERMRKRLVHRQPPDSSVLREAMRLANGHLDYIDYLIDHRVWMAG
jgi:glutathione S-transferase